MALFTDADIVTLDDLLPFETSLVQVASSHGINVDTKIALATNAISDRLLLWLLSVGASDPQWLNRRIIGLSTVVMTPTLQRWLCFDSLSRFFAEAYNVQLNTRFHGKWIEYQTASTNGAEMVFMSGIGIVYNPLPKPAMPSVAIESGTVGPQALFVQTSWVDSLGNESAVSPINGIILDGTQTIVVAMSEGALDVPPAAVGWNVYAGTVTTDITRQNSIPLATGSSWDLPVTGLVDGIQPGNGQQPDFYIQLSRQILRG
jgi:hypothetical protein